MPKEAEEALPPELAVDVLAALAATAESGPFGFVVSRPGNPPELLWVPGIARLLGYEPDEFRKIPYSDHFDQEGRDQLEARRRDIKDGHFERRFDIYALKRDRTRLPLEVLGKRVDIGGRPCTVSVLYDLSGQKQAMDALAASEARFRTLVESAPDGVLIVRGTTIAYLNATAARLFGFEDARRGIGTNLMDAVHPGDVERARERLGVLSRTRKPFAEPAEYRTRDAAGRETTVEISSIPIDFEGAPATLGFARDITERKAIQEKLVQADRLAAVGTLAAGMAHEINNPLAYVILGLQFLERELPKIGGDAVRLHEAAARLREVRGGAERVATIVRDLKTFARADEVARGAVDLRGVMEAAVRISDNEVRHRARLTRHYHDAPAVDANAARLEQVFLNLLLNAAHAVSEHDPAASEIRVSVRSLGGGRVVAEVSDNGPGIAPEVLRHVFDPFFTTKPIGVGTGLGLPICRSIVESFGGSIELDSAPGGGTTARVVLPAFADETGTSVSTIPPRVPSNPPERKMRVLVVDDEPLVGAMLRRMLAQRHAVEVAASAEEALRMLDAAVFDAIVCDVMMPEMTGMDLYATLRKRDPSLASRMVFMTGGAFLPRVAEFLATLENPTLEKPFDLEMLTFALRQVVAAEPDGQPTPV
ncbi:MAG TPA: ATP-binding protein [Polyangiaceae bacterium]|jgi:PAS domain S-box-containing protein|nr:ATP-binding protein [Polyangiaceae bacterium]